MLKTNVIKKWYKLTLQSATGSTMIQTVQAESPHAAALLWPPANGWTLMEVTEL